MKKFPSTIFRSELRDADQAVLDEGRDWFLPYILYNMDLAKLPDTILPSKNQQQRLWKRLADFRSGMNKKQNYTKTKAKQHSRPPNAHVSADSLD